MATRYIRCERCKKPITKDSAHYIPKVLNWFGQLMVMCKITDDDEMVCKDCKDEIVKECESKDDF